ncbi:hypothetical protein DYB32_007685 [Aphanomyces invadans]|uniref:Fibronectin type-III domain-containing protein n=1 Tax=Aphanomyces invadans TaxID=157072 RepID=A0A418B193_9STRA|nr:hypothetical protein DYB32_007685 [Aphanomyces invadans]
MATADEVKMEIDVDPEKLRNRKKKKVFLQRRDDVIHGVGAKAAELRRRLFNRRTKTKADVANLPLVKQAKKDALDVRMALVEHDVKARMIDAHTRTHFELAESFRYLNQSLRRSTRSVRNNTSTLEDLARRVEFMQQINAKSPVFTQPPAQEKVKQEVGAKLTAFLPQESCPTCGKVLATSALLNMHEPFCRGIVARELPLSMLRCKLCHRAIKGDRLAYHMDSCQRDHDRHAVIWASPAYALKGQPPEPPTAFRVVRTTHSSISFAWNPPTFTADLAVVDFQIQLHVLVIERFQRLQHRQHERTFHPLPVVSTSRWALHHHPVAMHGYTVDRLPAKSTFGRMAVRCKTLNGWSGWTDCNDEDVSTTDPVAPSRPLFLSVGLVTVDSIALSWLPPFDMGGEPIDEYIVSFSGYVQVHDGTNSIDMRAAELKDFTRRVKAPDRPPVNSSDYSTDRIQSDDADAHYVCCTIDGLRSGQSYSRWRVCAVSVSGVIGDTTPELPPVRTLVHGKEYELVAELQEAINSTATTIDSAFYNGFVQRYDRKHYIQLVADTIRLHHPSLSGRVDAMLPVESDSSEDSDTSGSDAESSSSAPEAFGSASLSSTPQLTLKPKSAVDIMEAENQRRLALQAVRRKQFRYRLHQLHTHVDTLEYNIAWADERCTVLVSMVEAAERRIMDKQAELERAREFKGPAMDSLAMHELDIERYYIVDTKADLRAVEDQKKADMAMLATKRAQIVTRQSALDSFETECELDQFKAARGATVVVKFKARHLSYFSSAWKHWQACVARLRDLDVVGIDIIGKGGVELKGVHAARTHLQSDLYSALHECRELSSTLQTTSHTTSQNERKRSNVFAKERKAQLLRGVESKIQESLRDEGDAHLDVGNVEAAVTTYEALLDNLTAMPSKAATTIDAQDPMQLSLVYNRLGRAHFMLRNYDRAANAFERASIVATSVGNPAESAVACRGLADCHLAKREWPAALDLYLKAAGAYEDVSDVGGEVASWRGIAACYREMDAGDLATEASVKADSLEHVLDQKMDHIENTLAELHSRLIGVTVKLSVERQCERVGAIVPRLRQERLHCKVSIMEEEKVLHALEIMLDEKKAIHKQAEADLKTSQVSDSAFVDSAVFLGVSTRYTVDEFQANVAKFLRQLDVLQLAIDRERSNSAIRISNLNDRIQEVSNG